MFQEQSAVTQGDSNSDVNMKDLIGAVNQVLSEKQYSKAFFMCTDFAYIASSMGNNEIALSLQKEATQIARKLRSNLRVLPSRHNEGKYGVGAFNETGDFDYLDDAIEAFEESANLCGQFQDAKKRNSLFEARRAANLSTKNMSEICAPERKAAMYLKAAELESLIAPLADYEDFRLSSIFFEGVNNALAYRILKKPKNLLTATQCLMKVYQEGTSETIKRVDQLYDWLGWCTGKMQSVTGDVSWQKVKYSLCVEGAAIVDNVHVKTKLYGMASQGAMLYAHETGEKEWYLADADAAFDAGQEAITISSSAARVHFEYAAESYGFFADLTKTEDPDSSLKARYNQIESLREARRFAICEDRAEKLQARLDEAKDLVQFYLELKK